MLSRATQTNEAGRCATLLPSLAQIAAAGGRPLALIEVGASAGLTLFPDRYGYEYDAGPGSPGWLPAGAAGSYPVLGCAVTGPVPLPAELPQVVWRAGIDLNPLDVRNPDDVAWLEALIWPEQDFRRERLRRAIAVAQADPPLLVAGDLNEQLLALAAQAPSGRRAGGLPQRGHGLPRRAGAEPVPRHHVTARRRTRLPLALQRGAHGDPPGGRLQRGPGDGRGRLRGRFLLLHNGKPAAITGPHGQSLEWL